MGAVLGTLIFLYMLSAICAWPYFWLKKTDRSQAPIERRLMGLFYALGWPYFVYVAYQRRDARAAEEYERSQAAQRILGSQGVAPAASSAAPSEAPPSARIRNPFDD